MAHVNHFLGAAGKRSTHCVAQVPRRSAVLAGLLLLLWTMACPASDAQDAQLLESRIKAAFLYRFASYVDWPEAAFAQSEMPLTIAVIGADTIAVELARVVADRRVNNRGVIVRRFATGDTVGNAHILFIGNNASAQLDRLLRAARPHPVLTVTESEGALAQGSVINFVIVDQRVRFEISRESAGRNRLKLSSRLLDVAQHVVEGQ